MKNIAMVRLCSALFAAILAVSAFTPVFSASEPNGITVSDGQAAIKSPRDIDRVVVDCRSAEAFGKTSRIHVHTPTEKEPDPYTGGKFSFSKIMNAMQVDYNPNAPAGREYRVMPVFLSRGTITAEYRYWVVVYAAKTDKPYELTLWNGAGAGKEIVVNSNGKDTRAQWVVSDAFDIGATAAANGQNCLTRWQTTVPNTITFKSEDDNALFFIKEFSFFKSPEDAKAYYAGVDLNKDPMEYGANAVKAGTSQPTTIVYTPSSNEPEPESKVEPVIMSFEGSFEFHKYCRFPVFEGETKGLEGLHEFVTLPDGTKCIKLNYHVYTGIHNGGYANYRMMPAFTGKGLVTTDHKFVRITYMTTDTMPFTITFINNANGKRATLAANTSLSGGKFVRSNAVDVSEVGMIDRLANGNHCSINFNSTVEHNSEIYIKEIAFFGTETQAYEYYGDSANPNDLVYDSYLFGEGADVTATREDPLWGVSEDKEDTLEITYTEKSATYDSHYVAFLKMRNGGQFNKDHRYFRILFSADHPEGAKPASAYLVDNKTGIRALLSNNVVDTDGEFVLSDPVCITTDMANRFASVFNALYFTTEETDAKYNIKALYFFNTLKEAEGFSVKSSDSKVTINGADISNYQIVVSEVTPPNVAKAAKDLASTIKRISGVSVPVVTDAVPESEYEILVGISNREKSYSCIPQLKGLGDLHYRAYIDGKTLVITSHNGLAMDDAVDAVMNNALYATALSYPDEINVPSDFNALSSASGFVRIDYWDEVGEAADPVVFYEDFDSDDGFFNEDNGEKNWKYQNGRYVTEANGFAASYLHVYEKNVAYKATFTYSQSESDGSIGILTRVNSEHAFVKAGYDFDKGEWFIDTRDGRDFFVERAGAAKAQIVPETEYSLELSVVNGQASLCVNGNEVIINAGLNHASPGRIGVFAENIAGSFGEVEITLLSGQGTLIPNVAHSKLPEDSYLEGGTVIERQDGSLSYISSYGFHYTSADNGVSWQKADAWADNGKIGYVNMIRLDDGRLMRINAVTVEKELWVVAQFSDDDGMTWSGDVRVCEGYYNGSTAHAGNMNDKLLVSPTTGRIFLCMTYESATLVEGRYSFARFYYSDDNGNSWTKSETDSWEIEGNEYQEYFAECKVLECDDGTIRLYCSWNRYGNVMYSDSTDGGKTFGPLRRMTELNTPTSSMQFVRDPYAENNTTYYMLWVNAVPFAEGAMNPRSRLSLAKSTDGKNWSLIGDVWRWESTFSQAGPNINHIVNPFIYVTEDFIICGSGFSDHMKLDGEKGPTFHMGQRQHIYSIRKDTLTDGERFGGCSD